MNTHSHWLFPCIIDNLVWWLDFGMICAVVILIAMFERYTRKT